ncbi:MAG: hypothetical protein JSR72_02170 [Proteobacteria bacterium]|nr:hypothetical protein [Pseudomonadota bacterium]
MPFVDIPAMLERAGHTGRCCLLEIISASPDTDIPDSAARLKAMGF